MSSTRRSEGWRKAQALQQSPEAIQERRRVAEVRLRQARQIFGAVKLRLMPMVRCQKPYPQFQSLRGATVQVTLDEAVDVWDLIADTMRFWRCWRASRRRTEGSAASVRRAWELWERSADDLKF